MPTNRRHRVRERRKGPTAIWQLNFLLTGKVPETGADGFNVYEGIDWEYDQSANSPARALWAAQGAELTAFLISLHPGRRPYAWWRYTAPQMRLQVGGGEAELPLFVRYRFGLPDSWVRSSYERNPPLFESQASFLDRHGLLTSEERARIEPAAFEPVLLELTPTQLTSDSYTLRRLHEQNIKRNH